jgi:hypothetical protein
LGERTANGHEIAQSKTDGVGLTDGAEDFAIIEQIVGAPSPCRGKG